MDLTHILQGYFTGMDVQIGKTLQWCHNECNGVSNHQPHDCFLNRLFRCRSKKTSKFCVTGLCAWNSPVTGEFPAQRARNVENVSIWWCHHVILLAWMSKLGKTIIGHLKCINTIIRKWVKKRCILFSFVVCPKICYKEFFPLYLITHVWCISFVLIVNSTAWQFLLTQSRFYSKSVLINNHKFYYGYLAKVGHSCGCLEK